MFEGVTDLNVEQWEKCVWDWNGKVAPKQGPNKYWTQLNVKHFKIQMSGIQGDLNIGHKKGCGAADRGMVGIQIPVIQIPDCWKIGIQMGISYLSIRIDVTSFSSIPHCSSSLFTDDFAIQVFAIQVFAIQIPTVFEIQT